MLKTADWAYHRLPKDKQDRLVLIDIKILFSMLYLQRGNFKAGELEAAKSLQLRRDLNLPEDLAMTNVYNYLGLACGSMERHEEARDWLAKSAAILEKDDDELHL